jgi:hypothetical protein
MRRKSIAMIRSRESVQRVKQDIRKVRIGEKSSADNKIERKKSKDMKSRSNGSIERPTS